jgi:hypothetical protein
MPSTLSRLIGLQIASHPNIYVLDTPGVLSPRFADDGSGPRLALTGISYFTSKFMASLNYMLLQEPSRIPC